MEEGTRIREDQSIRKAHVCIFFWVVVDVDKSQSYECRIIKGTCRLHSVRMSNNAIFEI